MLKRSKLLVAFLIVTVLCASIGFALVTDTLSVDGTIKLSAVNDTNFDGYIILSNAQVQNGEGVTAGKAAASISDDTLTITIPADAFTNRAQTITVTATITSTYTNGDVTLTPATPTVTLTNLDGIASATANLSSNSLTTAAPTSTLTITITLNEMPLTAVENGTISCTITATAGE